MTEENEKVQVGSGFQLLSYRGTCNALSSRISVEIGAMEADGEQDSELTPGDAPGDEVICLVWRKAMLSFYPVCFHMELGFPGYLGYCI